MSLERPFRSEFAQTIFRNKYAHDGAMTWTELAMTLVLDVCDGLMPRDEMMELVSYIAEMKFIPGGRYLYYAGRDIKAFNNCLGGETRIYTDKGLRRLDSFKEGERVNVLSPVTGTFLPATAHAHGDQMLRKVTFASVRGRSQKTWSVRATRSHHWPLIDGADTYDLRVGDVVPAGASVGGFDNDGFVHGLIFADGTETRTKNDGTRTFQIRLCGKKNDHAARLTAFGAVERAPSDGGDRVFGLSASVSMKEMPPESASPAYIASFIRGWVEFDGHDGRMIHSTDRKAIEWFVEHAPFAGYVVTGDVVEQGGKTNFAPDGRKPLYRVTFKQAGAFSGFKVVSIEEDRVETVYCPFEPQHNRIVLEGGIDTFQCYLLRSEEDTREDWAALSWRSESCLSTGGGIGNDYSVYRERGAPLKRTGGQASGPVSKMRMINEIGREVMQGGSRRSAIYASLNHRHADIPEFLRAKDWDSIPVAGTNLSVGDLKKADFNYAAPLDMTNVSVNYDNAWRDGDRLSEVFVENCRLALRNGEPGFSFNFDEKENETLRNACTEVTSEDDSDVCNLGSINLSRIASAVDLDRVVELATKFLLCGTLKADLPYEKVYAVREKNRRLGLGLMGVHEWLIARGYRYEMNEELRAWLGIWRDRSDVTARRFADELGVSRPVAVRAIAPTGTIGIMAGTTTGIEPIFAVAYKRRYLVNGTTWMYQYVVDSAAKELIDMYGIDPDKVESAIDLAADYERRIAFQADVQDFVDMSISSTINLPSYGSDLNNDAMVMDFARTLAHYAPRLRGFTCYPDGARGGQPLTSVAYSEAKEHLGREFEESVVAHDICDISGKGGTCGI